MTPNSDPIPAFDPAALAEVQGATVTPGNIADDIANPAKLQHFVGTRPRVKAIPLDWPFEYDGVLYSEINLRRLTVREIREYFAKPEAERTSAMPWFDVPADVLERLDLDDEDKIMAEAKDFIPARFQVARDSGRTPADGDA